MKWYLKRRKHYANSSLLLVFLCYIRFVARFATESIATHYVATIPLVSVLMEIKMNLIGKKFNRLTILSIFNQKNKKYCVCRCDCGKIATIRLDHIKSQETKSCGCYNQEVASKRMKTHGMSKSRIYKIYNNMERRCKDITYPQYYLYGGRGINICEEWSKSFCSFYKWAINNGYKENLTIDRIDNNKSYCPENCRWVTMLEQSNNRRTNSFVDYNGETHTFAQWERILGFPRSTLSYRFKKGWDKKRAFTTPVKERKNGNF